MEILKLSEIGSLVKKKKGASYLWDFEDRGETERLEKYKIAL